MSHRIRSWLVVDALLCLACLCVAARAEKHSYSKVAAKEHKLSVELGTDGKLSYVPDANGNVVPDFSNCGYHGGGVALPDPKDVPVHATVKASGGEDGPAIQAAIDTVSKLPPDANGVRGAVLLTRGTYHIAGVIMITHGGVVLRGEGDDMKGTVLMATGTQQRTLITISGKGGEKHANNANAKPAILSNTTLAIFSSVSQKGCGKEGDDDEEDPVKGTSEKANLDPAHTQNITDEYVPVGAHSFTVANAAGFKVGDHVIVHRPSTAEWIHTIGMDQIPSSKKTTTVQWTAGSKDLFFDRIITAINGNKVTVDAPICNALERRYGGGTLSPFNGPEPITESGVENMRGISEYHGDTDEKHAWSFICLQHLKNGYVRHITAEHFGYAAVEIYDGSKWITVQDCSCLDAISKISGMRRDAFNMKGCSLCLVQRCTTRNGRHDYIAGETVPGPNVFMDCHSTKTHNDIGPHQRWSVGILWDNIDTTGKFNIPNRGNTGTGHGWAGANQVAWNCNAGEMIVENPPTAQNWAIGCKGPHKGDGIWESIGHHVEPRSLYLQQIQDRLGPQAVENVTRDNDKS